MAAIPFYKSVYGTHFLAGDSGRSRGLDHRAMPGAPVSYRLSIITKFVVIVSSILLENNVYTFSPQENMEN